MAKREKIEVPAVGHNSYVVTRFNAVKHAVLSRYTVLPWEDESEYGELLEAFVAEHEPEGPTETHLVEEIAGIVWRKRRLRLAECAAYRQGLNDTFQSFHHTGEAALAHLGGGDDVRVREAVRAGPKDTERDLRDLDEDQAMTERALKVLRSGKADAYDKAISVLREDTRDWWKDKLTWELDDYEEGEDPYTPDASGLLRFLQSELSSWYESRRRELANRPLIQSQAFGEALDPQRLDKLARYEAHLDRKLERMLTMLVRLQELRPAPVST